MHYEAGEPTKLVFDIPEEVQALSWAASEVRQADPDDPVAQSAYQSARSAVTVDAHGGSQKEDFTVSGDEADAVLSVLKRWVETGPPEEQNQVTDAARAKSYRTACAIVAKTAETSEAAEPTSSF